MDLKLDLALGQIPKLILTLRHISQTTPCVWHQQCSSDTQWNSTTEKWRLSVGCHSLLKEAVACRLSSPCIMLENPLVVGHIVGHRETHGFWDT